MAVLNRLHKAAMSALTLGHTSTGYDLNFGSDSEFRVTVLATTTAGTIAALRTAATLAAGLCARVRLVAVEEVPFRLSLDTPQVSADFLQRQMQALVCASGIRADEVAIDVWLCRDRDEGLRWVLPARSLVVIGGKAFWWCRRERALKSLLLNLGHQVIFAELSYSPGVRAWWRGLFTSRPQPPLSPIRSALHRNRKEAA